MEKKNLEAAKLQRKKSTINKAKVKKTIKNTLCRPDPIFWPVVTEEQSTVLETALACLKVEIPDFNKLHWKVLKSIPKDQRPKQPKIKKVEGLMFGLRESTEAINSNQCSAVIIDSSVNPRTIAQPLIEACVSNQVHIICLNNLRMVTSLNFGIQTSCLSIKTGYLEDITTKIEEFSKLHKIPKPTEEKHTELKYNTENTQNNMEIDKNTEQVSSSIPISFSYLYRNNKNTRVFNPSLEEPKAKKAFIGQDFIEFSNKPEEKSPDSKAYMSMILKRITNNQNRTKRK